MGGNRGDSADKRPQFSASQRGQRGMSASSRGSKKSTKNSAREDKDKAKGNENKWGCTLKIGDGKEAKPPRPKNIKTSDRARAAPAVLSARYNEHSDGLFMKSPYKSPNKAKLVAARNEIAEQSSEEDFMRNEEQQKFEELARLAMPSV